MSRLLTDTVIVITGASSGIGAATAREAARAQMRVVLAARREDRLQHVVDEIAAAGGQAIAVPTDVTQDADVERLIERTMEAYGRLDVMVANAGYGFLHSVEKTPDAIHRQVFETNYWGTVRCVRGSVPIMRQQGAGHIVIVSSIVGRIGLPYYASYSATKAAQDALAMALRAELKSDQIDVSSVHPITTATEFFDVSASIGGRDAPEDSTPKWLVQSPRTVACAIVRCLRRPKPEVWPSPLTRYGAGLGLLMPRLTGWALGLHARKDRRRLPELSDAPKPQESTAPTDHPSDA